MESGRGNKRLRNSGGNGRGKTKVRRNRRCSIVEQVSTAPLQPVEHLWQSR